MDDKSYRRFVWTVVGGFTFCTGFWAVLCHFPWPKSSGGEASLPFWLLMNLCNLGLVVLGVPMLGLLYTETRAVIQLRSVKPMIKFVPAFLACVSTPQMFHPFWWMITFVGAS